MLRGPRPASVTTLAIIGMIIASWWSIKLLLGVIGIVGLGMGRDPMSALLMADPVYMGHMIFSTLAYAGLAVMLWFGTIGSLSLKLSARKMMIICAISYMGVLILDSAVYYGYIMPFVMDKAFAAAISSLPPGTPATPTPPVAALGVAKTMFYVLIPIVVIFGSAYPVCVLIFYTRRKVVNAFNGIFEGYVGSGFPVAQSQHPPQGYYPPQPPQGYQ